MATHSNGETIQASHINAKFDAANVDTDNTLAANSDSKVASQKATKSYVDTKDSANVKTSGDQTINGVKTFGSIPVLPASDPTADNQAARKKYVDAQAITVIKGGTSTRNSAGTQTIAHGLGKTPKRIRLVGVCYDYYSSTFWYDFFDGVYIPASSLNASSSVRLTANVSYVPTSVSTNANSSYIVYAQNGEYAKAQVSVDATNITIVWENGSSGRFGYISFRWEAEG